MNCEPIFMIVVHYRQFSTKIDSRIKAVFKKEVRVSMHSNFHCHFGKRIAIEKIYRKWDRVVSSNFIFTQKMGMLMLHNKYHSHWWPGDAKPLADILLNYVLRNIPVSAPVVVNWGLSGNKRPQPSMHWCIVVASSTNSMTVLMLAWRIIIQWGH